MESDKRKQHYIPKFYLRNFSINGNGKQIGVFNSGTSVFIPGAKLKTQGCSPFFYGKDGKIENVLADIESEAAPLLMEIINTKNVPRHGSDEFFRTLYFVTLMDLRNPTESTGILESGEKLRETLHEMSAGRIEIEPGKMMNKEEAIKIALSHVNMCYEACVDLKLKLLINNTSVPFLTSDNPVVKYNQFLEQKKWNGGMTGYGLVGLQIFWPLNPNLILLFYDMATYKIGNKRDNTLLIENSQEVDQINLLQMLNCDSLLFFNQNVAKAYLEKLSSTSARFTKANRPVSEIFPLIIKTPEGQRQEKVIRKGETDCKVGLKISNINFSKKGKNYQFTDRAAQLRPGIEQVLSEYGYDRMKKFLIPNTQNNK